MAEPHFTMFWAEDIPRLRAVDDAGKATEVAVIAGRVAGAERRRPLAPPPDSWAAQADADVAIWTLRMEPGARWTLPAARGAAHAAQALFLQGRRAVRSAARRSTHAGGDRAARRRRGRAGQRRRSERVPAAAGPADRRAGGAVRPVRDEHARPRSPPPSPTTAAPGSAAGRGPTTRRCTAATRRVSRAAPTAAPRRPAGHARRAEPLGRAYAFAAGARTSASSAATSIGLTM